MPDSATGRAIFTPQAYVRALKHALKKRNIMVNVEDILAVPDYVGFMQKHIDKNLTRCDKEEWSELEWTFEAVETSESYPTGVKVTYRKYTNDNIVLVYEDEGQRYGFSSCKYKVNRHPMPIQPGDPGGMYLLILCQTVRRIFYHSHLSRDPESISRHLSERLAMNLIRCQG